ncbi:hypothetical protein [Vreelandella titanicae]|uniref:hypothetical protein n=1 Tax=Vreelandella titanicae TaxID=664683 RepID=UPI0039BF92D1
MKKLEEVFKRSGLPTHTFVEPVEYKALLVSVRTPGRGTVVEGPSGIGKTTSVLRIIESIPNSSSATIVSGRNPDDFDLIAELPNMGEIGLVLIDDFHRLPDETKFKIADHVKLLADREDCKSKIVIIGINKAGQSLINYASDLTGRIDTISFESNPKEKIEELITLGEAALNISMNIKSEIADDAQGSFHLAQMLCHECCLEEGILDEVEHLKGTSSSIEVIRERVLKELNNTFFEKAKLFATGPRLRKEGRAPYFYLLHWLANGTEWSLNVNDAIKQNPEHRGSIGQIVDKGFLNDHINRNTQLQDVIHFDQNTTELSIEDPKFFYFIKNLLWTKFIEKVGFSSVEFKSRYDYALSFAGSDRNCAEGIFNFLNDRELSVFYDFNEQHRILAENVEDYLGPIYRSEATFVIAILGPDYPKRIWTKFESEQFKQRFGDNAVIPIWFNGSQASMFDETTKYGGLIIDREANVQEEIARIGNVLCKKMEEFKKI